MLNKLYPEAKTVITASANVNKLFEKKSVRKREILKSSLCERKKKFKQAGELEKNQ